MNIFFRRFARLLGSFLILWLACSPLLGQAWFFSSPQVAAQEEGISPRLALENTQNIALLSSVVAMTSDLKPDNGAILTFAEDGALAPEIGVAGTLADVASDGPGADAIVIYTVVPGDSVATIAKRFGVSENTVRWANNLKAGQPIHVDDTLILLPLDGLKYSVKSGDTIDSIAKKFKLSRDEQAEFLDFNNMTSTSLLTAGQTLIVPGAEPVITVATPKKAVPKGNAHVNTGSYTPGVVTTDIVRGYFIKPVPCQLSQKRHDKYAVDMSCHTSGTPIKAAADGTVLFAKYGNNGGYGNLIIIKHPNGMTTFYAHIKADGILVSQGQAVSQGTVIGYVGSTGRSTGPHLHFEVRGGGNPGFDYSGSAWKQ